MDDFQSHLPEESSSLRPKTHERTPSFLSNTSANSFARPIHSPQARIHTPSLRHRPSTPGSSRSNVSTGDHSEIISPVPRRHHQLQAHESRHWLDTPPLPPSSTRAGSPSSAISTTSPGRGPRLKHTLSFSSMASYDGPVSATASYRLRMSHEKRPVVEDSMARRWVRWMHKQNLKHWVVPCAVLISTLVKWCIGLGSYSGHATPPMYGDYEAQRHWMELTIHLPPSQWYNYDLEYWGLDYPPLTAYVSWLCGIVGNWIDPSWFALDQSRGIETPESKVYMRATVMAFDALVYVSAVIMFTRIWHQTRSSRSQHVALLTLLLQPALLLIDFGHFQYNSVMLGFTLYALNCFAMGQDILGAVYFCLSLGFKQMALYYAPAIGSYLLAKCVFLGPVAGRKLFINLALVTSVTFLLLFLPFVPPFAPSLTAALQPIKRIFPFARGLFEDKVANFWCASNVVIKWKRWMSTGGLVKLSTALTALGFLPSVVGLGWYGWKYRVKPVDTTQDTAATVTENKVDSATKYNGNDASSTTALLPLLPYALLNASMSFFLFSFQVHEKTILVPLLPLTLLLSGSSHGSEVFEIGMLVNNVAVFSMWPLLKRDGLAIPYIAITLLWNRLMGYNPFRVGNNGKPSPLQCLSITIYAAAFALHLIETIIPPPRSLPDIFPVLNVLISTPVFALTWLWSIKRSVEVGWAIGGLGSSSSTTNPASAIPPSFNSSHVFPRRSTVTDRKTSISSSIAGDGDTGGRQFRTRSLGFARGASLKQLPSRTASAGTTR
ncbi:hypothetical protein K474DRAFT_1656321 [Panus rudis PR-1116 ss-1]|nr:hypothetical protein K474DRAFT_1656321 [Panus rudis PR-1116 ss-1]